MFPHETWHLCRSNPSGPCADESNRWHLHGLNSRHHLQASTAAIFFKGRLNGFQREKSGPQITLMKTCPKCPKNKYIQMAIKFQDFPMGIHPHHMVARFGFGAQHDVAKRDIFTVPSGNQTWRNPPFNAFNVKCSN